MKLQINQDSLQKQLNTAIKFVSTRSTLPVLSNILLEAGNGKLAISATNLEISLYTTVGAKITKEGKIAVPARIFYEIISNLNPGVIELEAEREQLVINNANFSSKISGINSAEFPKIPNSIGGDNIILKIEDLLKVLGKTMFAISTDETRPVLTGSYFSFTKRGLVIVSTDGFRLSKNVIPGSFIKKSEISIVIPRNILIEIERLSSENDDIKIAFNNKEGQVVFNIGGIVASSRLLDGNYPDFEKVIPKKPEFEVNVDRMELMQAVKLAAVFARDSSNVVKVEVFEDSISLESESQYSGSQKSKVQAKISGNKKSQFKIAFNCRFIEEILGVFTGESVVLGLSDPNSPGIFKDPEDNDFIHIIMPVKLT